MYNFIKKRMESPLKVIEDESKLKEVEEAHLAVLAVLKEDNT